MSFCLYGHPSTNGGPTAILPILVFDDGVNQLFMDPAAFVRGAGTTLPKTPVILADATAVTTEAAKLDMIVQAIETTVSTNVSGSASSVQIVPQGQVLNPPNNKGVSGSASV
jgi:hypothetical protein